MIVFIQQCFRAVLLCVLALMVLPVEAATLVRYDFTGATGDQAAQAASFAVGPISASDLTRGAGLTPNLGGNSINSSGWTTALAIDADDYYEFTLSPTAGFSLSLDRISFAERRSGSGIRNFQIRSSLDNFATGLDSVPAIVPDDTMVRQQSFALNNTFLGLTDPVTLRLYGYAAEASGGTWRLENYTGELGSTGGLTIDGSASLLNTSTIYMQDLGADFVPQSGNGQGDIVGYKLSTNQAAVRRANGVVEDLGTLGGSQSRATAISDDGLVIVGWAENGVGAQNSFKFESGVMNALLTTAGSNQAIGLDGQGNIYINRQAGSTNSIRRWNSSTGTVDLLVNNAQTSGVNLDGTFVGTALGTAFSNDGNQDVIFPTTYNPAAGLSDSDLSAGSLSGSAAYYRLGDALAQTIPNIAALSNPSTATGVNDHDLIVGNTAGTSFLYNLNDEQLIDLNAQDVSGVDVLFINEVYGITDADIFFGKYTDLEGQPRYFRASFNDVFPQFTPGDFDEDGDVDGRDFLVWQRDPGVGDLADWQGNYGDGMLAALSALHGGGTPPANAVPEPGGVALLMLLYASLAWRYRAI